MPTYDIPATPLFKFAKFGLSSNTMAHVSPLNGATQTFENPGAKWFVSYTLPPMVRADAEEWLAFLIKLRGMSGRFYGYDPSARTPRGVATGTPLVNGASQTGTSLATDGWTINTTNIMRIGDYFQVGTELKKIVANASSNGTGQATLTFEPPIRNAPADNAAIIVTNPVCVMRLSSDSDASWDVNEALHYGIAFSGEESLT